MSRQIFVDVLIRNNNFNWGFMHGGNDFRLEWPNEPRRSRPGWRSKRVVTIYDSVGDVHIVITVNACSLTRYEPSDTNHQVF